MNREIACSERYRDAGEQLSLRDGTEPLARAAQAEELVDDDDDDEIAESLAQRRRSALIALIARQP